LSLAKHLTAEAKTEEFIPVRGVVTKWECLRRQNHFFDALYYASAAGWYCGVRLTDEPKPAERKRVSIRDLAEAAKRQDGRPWIDNERWNEMRERRGW
jgi:hypothetical protein